MANIKYIVIKILNYKIDNIYFVTDVDYISHVIISNDNFSDNNIDG